MDDLNIFVVYWLLKNIYLFFLSCFWFISQTRVKIHTTTRLPHHYQCLIYFYKQLMLWHIVTCRCPIGQNVLYCHPKSLKNILALLHRKITWLNPSLSHILSAGASHEPSTNKHNKKQADVRWKSREAMQRKRQKWPGMSACFWWSEAHTMRSTTALLWLRQVEGCSWSLGGLLCPQSFKHFIDTADMETSRTQEPWNFYAVKSSWNLCFELERQDYLTAMATGGSNLCHGHSK